MDTKQSSRSRPKLVWVISILCIISIGFNILSYALIFNGTIPITEAQRAYFDSLTILAVFLEVIIHMVIFVGVILLFLLRPYAYHCFLSALVLSIIEIVYLIIFKNFLGAWDWPVLFFYAIYWLVGIAIILYAKNLFHVKLTAEPVASSKRMSIPITPDKPLDTPEVIAEPITKPSRKARYIIPIILALVFVFFLFYLRPSKLKGPETHLMRAASKGQTETVLSLLDKGVDVNAKQISPRELKDWTALMWAATMGHTDTVKILLDHGAEVNAKNWFNSTALMAAAAFANVETVKILIEGGAAINAKENDGDTALSAASFAGNTNVVKLLLESGADVNAKRSTGFTSLMTAANRGHFDTMQVLLSGGADPNAKEDDGWTALMYATRNAHINSVQALLDSGADVNEKNKKGWTALMMAARKGHSDIVLLLLASGSKLNTKNSHHKTALKLAEEEGHKDIVKMLREGGVLEGPYTLYTPSERSESKNEFKDGKMDGKWTFSGRDGTKLVELQYKDGLRHGKCYMWYGFRYKKGRFRGNIKQVMEFERGLANGNKRSYYPSGALRSKELIDSGKIIEVKFWNIQGKLVPEKEALAISRSALKADIEYLSKLESYIYKNARGTQAFNHRSYLQ